MSTDGGERAYWDRLLDGSALDLAAKVVSASPDADLTGRTIGPYVVEATLGSGAAGDVYRARDTRLRRDVALKVIPGLDETARARVLREAQVLASLAHPQIAAVHGLEEADGVAAIVMELADGGTLADRLARGPLPIDEALSIARQIADALEAAHERGIVHRDLKPSNVGLRADGTVKVLDFGLAGEVWPDGDAGGLVAGTPAYMSPEQARGGAIDRRSDIWAFGIVLHEMLTGRRPADGLVDLEAWPAAVSPGVRPLVERCLARDPRQRLRDIGEARVALEAIARAPATPTRIDPRGRSRAPLAWFAIAGTLAVAIGGLALAAALRTLPGAAPSRPTRLVYPLAADQALAVPTPHHVVALSPDGAEIVYIGNDRLYLRDLSERNARPVAGTETLGALAEPVFSPDGRAIGFWSSADHAIKTIPATGGAATAVARADAPFGLSWSTAGLLYGAREGVVEVPSSGGEPVIVATVGADQQAHGPQRLPGGALLFTIATGSAPDRWDRARVVVQPPGGARRTLLDGASDARYVPTGHLVYAARDGVHAVPFDLDRLAVTGTIASTLEGVRGSSGRRTGAAQFAVSDGGSIVYVPGAIRRGGGTYSEAGAAAELVIGDRDGRVEKLPLPRGPYRAVRASPDGQRLAIASEDGGDAAIFVVDRRGAAPLRRLTSGGSARAPEWTSDGTHIVFQSDRDGPPAIYWQPADGSAPAERLTSPRPGEVHEPEAWRPDGGAFLYSIRAGRETSLWEMTLRDRRTAPFGDVRAPVMPGATFSPDGRWVAYVTTAPDGGSTEIVVQPYPATGAQYPLVVAQPPGAPRNSPHKPLWTRDGRSLLYVPRLGGLERVPIVTAPAFAFGRADVLPRPFLAAPPDARRTHDVLPDGRIVGLVSTEPTVADEYGRTTIQVVLHWLRPAAR